MESEPYVESRLLFPTTVARSSTKGNRRCLHNARKNLLSFFRQRFPTVSKDAKSLFIVQCRQEGKPVLFPQTLPIVTARLPCWDLSKSAHGVDCFAWWHGTRQTTRHQRCDSPQKETGDFEPIDCVKLIAELDLYADLLRWKEKQTD